MKLLKGSFICVRYLKNIFSQTFTFYFPILIFSVVYSMERSVKPYANATVHQM